MGPRHHRLYRGHRAKSLNITEEELVEIRGAERTFDGAYWRTALKAFSMGMIIIRLFTNTFYKIGIIFVVFGMALLGISILRRKAAGDVFDQRKPFETSGFWVMITTFVTTVTYLIMFVMIMKL
ncbi:hypothetical protein BC939DRAFT_404671 [Gamsiella multidivaricata]|uniref:uncharacterized protein n=1 Tax=Gamsiella multidivaricata TaxID=101098 RepID=UPI00222102FB|nr:uncharacterized protein BC939DRAFT_404671 [Gamsiella multidivaricata]KAI7815853.1 hypothetical protein BC939DRAFT_404671 [Gamsiella multidivaricata]